MGQEECSTGCCHWLTTGARKPAGFKATHGDEGRRMPGRGLWPGLASTVTSKPHLTIHHLGLLFLLFTSSLSKEVILTS
jgi:hypothetical protein